MSRLPLHSQTIGANTSIHAHRATETTACIRILGVKLAYDAGLRRNHVDLTKSGAGYPAAPISIDIGLVSKLPNVRGIAAIHFKDAGRRTELDDHDVNVLPNKLRPQASDDFLTSCCTATHYSA